MRKYEIKTLQVKDLFKKQNVNFDENKSMHFAEANTQGNTIHGSEAIYKDLNICKNLIILNEISELSSFTSR